MTIPMFVRSLADRRPLVLTLFFLMLGGCNWTGVADSDSDADDESQIVVTEEDERQIVAFCGDCHALPRPESFPKAAWFEEVEQGFKLYVDSGRSDLVEPPKVKVVAYFQSQAPQTLPDPEIEYAEGPPPVEFKQVDWPIPAGDQTPAVSHVRYVQDVPGLGSGLLSCDMRHGYLRWSDLKPSEPRHVKLAKLTNPAHVEPADLDGDGRMDFVVADLGRFLPADHHEGSIQWIHENGGGSWQSTPLEQNVSRIAMVQPGDFTGDGRQDLVVAEFGWRSTGALRLLKNLGVKEAVPAWENVLVDERHGAIHVPACDLNGDGKLDFVAIISQEYEQVVAFLGDGSGAFDREILFDARDASYGSSGIELVDLDGDGDLDVLYTNGDTFDSFLVKPYHSVQWLENEGAFPFARHELTKMPGAHRALPGDMDGDGDLDIVTVALLPRDAEPAPARYDRVILLEQTAPGKFVRHKLAGDHPQHASFDMGDFDEDGDLDLAIGWFLSDEPADRVWMSIWWNQSDVRKATLEE